MRSLSPWEKYVNEKSKPTEWKASEKSKATCTSKKPFEASTSQTTPYYVNVDSKLIRGGA